MAPALHNQPPWITRPPRSLVAGDLKTANIFLTTQDVLKIGDFGISCQLEHTLDMRQTCVGSPYFMSPEVCQDQPYNNKSDVWALGCVLYELCELKPAFGGSGNLIVTVR